jgi:hypothetical protein
MHRIRMESALQALYLHFSIEDKYIHEFALRAIDAPKCIPILSVPTISDTNNCNIHLAGLDSRSGVDAVLGWALGDRLGLVTGGGTLELLANSLDASGAGTGDRGSAAKVGVDASKDLSVVGLDILDDDAAGDGVLAVTACAVELAEVHDS